MNLRILCVSAVAIGFASGASAATVTKSYTVTSTFNAGPVATLIQSFELTFDPGTTGTYSVSNYYTSSNLPSFSAPIFGYVNSLADGGSTIAFSKPADGRFVSTNNDDVFTEFGTTASGDFSGGGQVIYSYSDLNRAFFSSAVTVTPGFTGAASGAVPEPATWAMMITGLGMIGIAARRRQAVKTTVTYA